MREDNNEIPQVVRAEDVDSRPVAANLEGHCLSGIDSVLGWIAQSMVSFNHSLSSIKTSTLSRY